jgi:TolB protein
MWLDPVPAECQSGPRMMVVVQDLSWSRDGLRLFFSAMRVRSDYSDYTPGKWAVYAYDVGTGVVTRITANSFSVNASPRSSHIVVGKMVDGNRDLYVLDDRGREISRLTDDPAEDFAGTWSPDGRAIAFTSKRGGRSEVFVAGADGSHPRRLIDAGTDRTLNPSWSGDGAFIAYYREKGDGADQIHIIGADGTGDRNVTNDAFNNVYPNWTPDGRVLYGQTQKGGVANLFAVKPDGTDKRPLHAIKSHFARYSPDGKRIGWLEARPESGVAVVIADPDGRVIAIVPLDNVGAEP